MPARAATRRRHTRDRSLRAIARRGSLTRAEFYLCAAIRAGQPLWSNPAPSTFGICFQSKSLLSSMQRISVESLVDEGMTT